MEFFFFKQKAAYEIKECDWSSDVCSSDLYKGRKAGSMGTMGCFSFFPSKNLGGLGDGGMVVTQDEQLADRLAQCRNHGMAPAYYHKWVGGNFRLDALQAAIVLVKLAYLDDWTTSRQANAARYDRLFVETGLVDKGVIGLPKIVMNRHIFNQYVIRVPRRDALREFLKEKSIGNEVYYPVPMHMQECFASLGYKECDCPDSEKAARETVALPVYPEVTSEHAQYVVDCVREFSKIG